MLFTQYFNVLKAKIKKIVLFTLIVVSFKCQGKQLYNVYFVTFLNCEIGGVSWN